ncbi:hypothetical protein [Myxococcus stipitatus]|uniref:hypothetical protein n=1 Tax=Myxococcus stipitatus TaxID=83455 RepID=UPI0030CF566F
MKWLIGGVAVAVLAVGCGGSEGSPDGSEDDTKREVACASFKLTFEEYYGFCHEGCIGKVVVSSEGVGSAARADHQGRPETTRDFMLTAAELDAVKTALDSGNTITWDAQYGCPDCYDQGTYELTYESCDVRKSTVVDPDKQPEALKPLFATMRDLLRANEP